MTFNAHDDEDPMSLVSELDAQMEAVEMRCPHCKIPSVTLIPALGTRWVLGPEHEEGCPDHLSDDDLPVAVVQPRPEWWLRGGPQG